MSTKGFLLSLLFFLAPVAAWGGLLRVESTTAYAQYRDDDQTMQMPFFEFFKGTYSSAKDDFQLDTNFCVTENSNISQQGFQLYALDGAAWLLKDRTRLTFGRSFFTHMTVRPRVLDSVAVEHFLFDKEFRLGAYVGIERPPEDLSRQRSTVSGVSLGYVSPNMSPLTAGLRFEHQAYEAISRNRMKFSLNQPLQYSLSPELMLDVERDLGYNFWSRAEVGADIYPNLKSTYGLRYQIYELDPVTQIDEPIINIFSQGTVQEASFKAGYFLSRDLYGSYFYAQDNFLIQAGHNGLGEKHQLALSAVFDRTNVNLTAYRITSYGGWVVGGRGGISIKLNSKMELSALSEYSRYQKITSSDRYAISNQIDLSYILSNLLHIDVMGELDSNNANTVDERFFLKLIYLAWKET